MGPAFVYEFSSPGTINYFIIIIIVIIVNFIFVVVALFCSARLHVDLLKEYLTANTFQSMVHSSNDRLEKQLLRLIPATTITTYYHELHGGAAGNRYSNRAPIGLGERERKKKRKEEGKE